MEVVNNYEHSSSSAEVDDMNRKRKISSQEITADDDIDDINDFVEVESEVESVELDSERSRLRRQNLSQPAEERAEEADDRIDEESLSDIHYNPSPSSPIHNQEDQGTPTPSVRAHDQTHKQQDTTEESIPIISPSQPETERSVDSSFIPARISSKLDSPSQKSTRPSSPSSSSATTDNPPEKSVPDQTSRSRAESPAGSGSHSPTERGTKPISITPPIPRFKGVGSSSPSIGILIPSPPRNTESGADGEEDGHTSPILSPGAKERLEQFDRTVMQIRLGKGKEKEQRLENGAILGKVKKSREKEREEEEDEEIAVTGSGGQEHLWTSQTKDKPGASESSPKPPEIEKKNETEPLFLSDESDSNARLKPQAEVKNQNGSGSKERSKEQLDKPLSSHHPSDSSRRADREVEEDNSSSTHVGSADTRHTDRKTFNGSSKTVSKTTSKPPSTNTAHASPPPSTTAVRRSVNTRSNSIVHDIIPETEESQESRSQSQETDMQVPIVSHLLVPPTTPPPVIKKFALNSHMKPNTPQPKRRPLSRSSSAVEMSALGVELDIDMDVGNDVDEKLNGERDDVDETVEKTSDKTANLAMTMESIPRISSRTSKSRSSSVSSQKSKNVKEPVPAEAEMPLAHSIHQESVQASQTADSEVKFTYNFPIVLISSSFA